MPDERRYVVRFRLTNGGIAELPFTAPEQVKPGQRIVVSGWPVEVEHVVREATAYTKGVLAGYRIRLTPELGPRHL